MKLSEIVLPEAIVPNLSAQTREQAVVELVDALASARAIPKTRRNEAVEAVLAREAKATTGIGKGVALPHAKLKGIKRPRAALGRSEPGIPFSALDGRPVHSVILLLSSPERPGEHLRAMEIIFKHLQRDIFRKFLRQSGTKQEIMDLLKEADELE